MVFFGYQPEIIVENGSHSGGRRAEEWLSGKDISKEAEKMCCETQYLPKKTHFCIRYNARVAQ